MKAGKHLQVETVFDSDQIQYLYLILFNFSHLSTLWSIKGEKYKKTIFYFIILLLWSNISQI